MIYFALLIWSGIYRYLQPAKPISENRKTVSLQAIDGEKTLARKIRFAYQETLSQPTNDTLPVILIHGSPGDSEAFDGLTELLKNRRIIAVDLPGFGDSEKDIPDYSVEAHARYLREFLDELKIEKAHFVAFSMGGGVVLDFWNLAPDRVASVSFVSAIGVQEYELFGNYYLNHIVHAAQLGALFALQELTPHLGIFDGGMPYARNFYDTDQRPLRRILEKIDVPFLIVHGTDDPLVPVEAAREHARIVPQSEFHEIDDNHFYVFMRPEKIARTLQNFWQAVENNTAKTRANADAERISEAQKPFVPQIIEARGATVFVFFLLFILLTFLDEDFAFLLAGIFAAQGWFSFTFAFIACLFGAFAAIFIVFLIGRFFGQSSLFQRLTKLSSIENLSEKLKNNRAKMIFLNRDFYGFRLPIYFTAGNLKTNFWRFFTGFLVAAICWTILLIGFAYLAAKSLTATSLINQQNFWALSILVFGIYFLANFLKKKVDRKS